MILNIPRWHCKSHWGESQQTGSPCAKLQRQDWRQDFGTHLSTGQIILFLALTLSEQMRNWRSNRRGAAAPASSSATCELEASSGNQARKMRPSLPAINRARGPSLPSASRMPGNVHSCANSQPGLASMKADSLQDRLWGDQREVQSRRLEPALVQVNGHRHCTLSASTCEHGRVHACVWVRVQ